MAFIGISVPHETARVLSELEVPGKRESTDHFHITMIYLGNEVPIEQLAKAVEVTYSVTSKTKPFSVSTSLVTSFPKGDDGVPIICKVVSEPLQALRKSLAEAFKDQGVEFNNKYPVYRPHVTLAYSDEESFEDFSISEVSWGAHELVLWGGDSGDKKLIVTFPFSLITTASRVAQRYLRSF